MTEPDDANGADGAADLAADAADTPPISPRNPSLTGWTVTSQLHHGGSVRIALLCGAALNLTALAILATILLDAPFGWPSPSPSPQPYSPSPHGTPSAPSTQTKPSPAQQVHR